MLCDSAHVGLQCTRAEELVYDSALISRCVIGIDSAVLGSWFHGPGCVCLRLLNADLNAAKPPEPGTKIQDSSVLSILVLGSMGRAAFNVIFKGRFKCSKPSTYHVKRSFLNSGTQRIIHFHNRNWLWDSLTHLLSHKHSHLLTCQPYHAKHSVRPCGTH